MTFATLNVIRHALDTLMAPYASKDPNGGHKPRHYVTAEDMAIKARVTRNIARKGLHLATELGLLEHVLHNGPHPDMWKLPGLKIRAAAIAHNLDKGSSS